MMGNGELMVINNEFMVKMMNFYVITFYGILLCYLYGMW